MLKHGYIHVLSWIRFARGFLKACIETIFVFTDNFSTTNTMKDNREEFWEAFSVPYRILHLRFTVIVMIANVHFPRGELWCRPMCFEA